jgi:alanine-glyoxylate transaminase/serine-glyoxylate transaminase/serine-pyruvate transaminase
MFAHGHHTLAIPGPSMVPDRVLQAMHRPSPNIYTGEIVEITRSIIPDLKRVARTGAEVAMYIGNGHAAWEAALVNTLSPGDAVLIPASAQFSKSWAAMVEPLGVEVRMLRTDPRAPIDPAAVGEALREDADRRIKAVLAVHVDTATSALSDLPAIRREMDTAGHPALLMADCIASMGCDRFEMDAWGVDVAMTGSQKGLMVPPGMAFVFFNERAERARDEARCVTAYWDWNPRARPDLFYRHFNGTAPTHHLYGLRAALDMLVHEEGVEAAWARHEALATAVWEAFEAWEAPGGVDLNMRRRAERSRAVTSVRLPRRGTELRDWLERRMGLTLGIGLGMAPPDDPAWHGFFRVGHMGHVSGQQIMGTLGAIEAGLVALGIPHGQGALPAAARTLAGAAGGAVAAQAAE